MGVSLPTAGRDAAHGLSVQFKKLEWRQADLPSIVLPAPPVNSLEPQHVSRFSFNKVGHLLSDSKRLVKMVGLC